MARRKRKQHKGQVFERFLTAQASARFLCRQIGMTNLANDLASLLSNLQDAHERLVNRQANRVLIQIVRSVRAGAISVEQAKESFRLDGAALTSLLKCLDSKSKNSSASRFPNHHGRRKVMRRQPGFGGPPS
jgi:hypothetical protein